MMNILITGGAGFIGSHLASYHLQKKDRVWVVDSLVTGRQENIAGLFSHPDFQFDLSAIDTWKNAKKAIAWADRIYHMAAIVGQKYVVTHPMEALGDNIEMCNHILKLAAQSPNKPKVLIASSSEVYGMMAIDKAHEDAILEMEPMRFLQKNYACAKLVAEMMALSCLHSKGLPCVIARIFNTIGPNQTGRYGMVVPSFIKAALEGKPLTIYGDGTQTRSFCHVKDTIRALDILLDTPAAVGQIINVGSAEGISILDLATLILKKTKSSSSICHLSYQEAYGMDFIDIKRRVPILDKLQRLTGFTLSNSLEDALTDIIRDWTTKKPIEDFRRQSKL